MIALSVAFVERPLFSKATMATYYYLRLCQPRTYLTLDEYIGKDGTVVNMGDDPANLMVFDNRDAAGEYLDANRERFPDRVIQICLHLGKNEANGVSRR